MATATVLKKAPRGVTIERLMLVSALIALPLWLLRPTSLTNRLEVFAATALLVLLAARVLMLIHDSKRCPTCGSREVGRVAAVSFWSHYLRCAACGQRMTRLWLGRLWDASDPRFDRHFRRDRPSTIWHDPIEPTPEDPATRTVGNLLLDKIDRDHERPESVDRPDLVEASASAKPPITTGVHSPVGERALKTLEAIRWSRRSRQ